MTSHLIIVYVYIVQLSSVAPRGLQCDIQNHIIDFHYDFTYHNMMSGADID